MLWLACYTTAAVKEGEAVLRWPVVLWLGCYTTAVKGGHVGMTSSVMVRVIHYRSKGGSVGMTSGVMVRVLHYSSRKFLVQEVTPVQYIDSMNEIDLYTRD